MDNVLSDLTPQEATALQSLLYHGAMYAITLGAMDKGVGRDMADAYYDAWQLSHSGDQTLYIAIEYEIAREGLTGELEAISAENHELR